MEDVGFVWGVKMGERDRWEVDCRWGIGDWGVGMGVGYGEGKGVGYDGGI